MDSRLRRSQLLADAYDRAPGQSRPDARTPKVVLRSLRFLVLAAALVLGISAVAAAADDEATYTHTQTIPVPPASNYAGSAGGDGWAVALTPDKVFNVFHHNTLQVACHFQSDASSCWAAPKTIRDESGLSFSVSGQPGLHLDQDSGRLYVYASRYTDGTAGVVCIDTTRPAEDPNPFCGFTVLAPAGDAPSNSGVSNSALVGNRLYAFNYVSGTGTSGGKNALLCFDVVARAACAAQPYAVDYGPGSVFDGSSFWVPEVTEIDGQVIVPVNTSEGSRVACFDGEAQTECAGSWPLNTQGSGGGAAFPILSSSGATTGLCLRVSGLPCFSFEGASIPTPAGLASVIPVGTQWNGPAVTIGPRIYLANGNQDMIHCFDYAAGASCPNFPKATPGAGFIYTVNRDPQRPDCIWINADFGESQIQNFDAFSGGACGEGPVRVLASSIVVPTETCKPTSYKSLQVVEPERGAYSTATVSFLDGSGNPIPGASDRPVDNDGTVSLEGLDLETGSGLPQFLITFEGAGEPSEVVVKLTWVAKNDPSCVKEGTEVTPVAPETQITGGPSGTTGNSTPTFTFTSNDPAATFECSIDDAAFTSCSSPYTTPALADGSHTFRVRAIGADGTADPTPVVHTFTVDAVAPAGTPTPPQQPQQPQQPQVEQPRQSTLPGHIPVGDSIDDLPNPQPYQSANVEPIGGEVFVQLPGAPGASASQVSGAPRGFIPLRQAAQLPFGSVLETTNGKVLVESTSANTSRRTQRAQFFDGRFQMIQKRTRGGDRNRPVTEMIIKGGGFRTGCPSRRASGANAGDEASDSRRQRARRRGRTVRRLWGRGNGRFRTRGRYSSATVRGTTWVVQDHCNGTLTRLPRRPRTSQVNIWDRLQRRTVILRAGQSHFAGRRSALRR